MGKGKIMHFVFQKNCSSKYKCMYKYSGELLVLSTNRTDIHTNFRVNWPFGLGYKRF